MIAKNRIFELHVALSSPSALIERRGRMGTSALPLKLGVEKSYRMSRCIVHRYIHLFYSLLTRTKQVNISKESQRSDHANFGSY